MSFRTMVTHFGGSPRGIFTWLFAFGMWGALVNIGQAGEHWSVSTARREIEELAKTEDPNQFVARYALLFARHHLVPVLNRGKYTPAGAGAGFELAKTGVISLHDAEGRVFVPKTATFVRAVTRNGQWKTVAEQPAAQIVALLIKTRKTLFLLNMKTEAFGIIETAPDVGGEGNGN